MSQNPTRKAGQQRPGRLRVLCRPRPPLRSITKEMELRRVGIFSANARKPSGHCWARGLLSRFLRSQLRRIGLGHPLQARPRSGQSVSMAMPCPIRNCSRGPPLRTRRPRSPQACQRGASPRRILVSLGGLLIAVAEPTPLRRSWMSPLGARPLADRFQTTTNRKTLAPPVTSLRDPTIPISVTELYDLTRRKISILESNWLTAGQRCPTSGWTTRTRAAYIVNEHGTTPSRSNPPDDASTAKRRSSWVVFQAK